MICTDEIDTASSELLTYMIISLATYDCKKHHKDNPACSQNYNAFCFLSHNNIIFK